MEGVQVGYNSWNLDEVCPDFRVFPAFISLRIIYIMSNNIIDRIWREILEPPAGIFHPAVF